MICNTNVQQHKRQVLQAEDICCSTCLCTTLSISREGGKIMCSTLGNLQKRMCAWCESLIALGLSSVGLRPSSSAPRHSSSKLGCRLAPSRLGNIQTSLILLSVCRRLALLSVCHRLRLSVASSRRSWAFSACWVSFLAFLSALMALSKTAF